MQRHRKVWPMHRKLFLRKPKHWTYQTKTLFIFYFLNFLIFLLHFFYLFIYLLFIYLFLFIFGCFGSLLLCTAFSSCDEGGLLFVPVHRLLIAVASLVAEQGLQARGLQQLWLAGSRAQAQQLWHMGLVAPRHVGSSQTRAQTRVP